MVFAVSHFAIVVRFLCSQRTVSRWRAIFQTSLQCGEAAQQQFVLDGELVIPIGGALFVR